MIEFWIDVGGTFTDCLAVGADGQISGRAKVLSSGEFVGVAGPGSDATCLVDAARSADPVGLLVGLSTVVAIGLWDMGRRHGASF